MELTYLTTADGLEHPALIWSPAKSTAPGLGAVIVHGRTGNFAEKHLTFLAEKLAALGLQVITFNNRGAYESGAAQEFFNDCILDIDAAASALLKRGCDRLILLGHSYGGMKASFYCAEKGFKNICGLVLMSTIPHRRFSPEVLARARTMIEEGQGDLIFSQREGSSFSLYQPVAVERGHRDGFKGETIELLKEAKIPIFTFASKDEWGWFHELTTALLKTAAPGRDITGGIFEGLSDHTYTGREDAAARVVGDWVVSKFISLPPLEST